MVDYGLMTLEDSSSYLSLSDYSQTAEPVDSLDNELQGEWNTKVKNIKSEEEYDKVYSVELSQPTAYQGDSHYHRLINKNKKSILQTDEPYNPIDILTSQEPDFMPNMYNIYIVLLDKNKNAADAWEGKPLAESYAFLNTNGRQWLGTDLLKNYSLIGMRASGIEIPQIKHESFELKMAGQSVQKISGKTTLVNKGSMEIALDQSMFLLDAMHKLNGDWFAQEKTAIDVAEKMKIIEGKQFYLNFGKLPIHTKNSIMSMIDIIVEYDADYIQMSRYNEHYPTNKDRNLVDDRYFDGKMNRVQRYILHDCRFLGRSSAISFGNSDANPIKATFPFIYRRILRTSATGYFA